MSAKADGVGGGLGRYKIRPPVRKDKRYEGKAADFHSETTSEGQCVRACERNETISRLGGLRSLPQPPIHIYDINMNIGNYICPISLGFFIVWQLGGPGGVEKTPTGSVNNFHTRQT